MYLRNHNGFQSKLFLGLLSAIINSQSYALPLKNNFTQSNDFLYSIKEGSHVLDSNYLKKDLNEPDPAFPMPSMNGNEIEKYVAEHNNAMPNTWGKSLVSLKTYHELHLNTIGTQLTCENMNGCSGWIYFYRNNRNNERDHNEFSFNVHDDASNKENAFTVVEESNTLVDQVFYKYTDGKFYRYGFNPIAPSIKGGIYLDGSYSFWEYYKANYKEPFLYIPIKVAPQEVAGFYMGYNNSELSKKDFPTAIMSNDGSQEKLRYDTVWQLKNYYIVPPNTSTTQSFLVTHGLTITDTTSWAGQLNFNLGSMISKEQLSFGITYTSMHSVSVQDLASVTESITPPKEDYSTINASYSLALVSKTIAPNLEQFMENVNKQISQNSTYSYTPFKWEFAKVNDSSDYDNIVDAKSKNANYVNSFISVKAAQ